MPKFLLYHDKSNLFVDTSPNKFRTICRCLMESQISIKNSFSYISLSGLKLPLSTMSLVLPLSESTTEEDAWTGATRRDGVFVLETSSGSVLSR